MQLRIGICILAIATLGWSDTLTLKSGQVVRGEYLGGDSRHVKFAAGDRVDTYSVDDVDTVQFGGGGQRSSRDGDRRDNDRDRRDGGFAAAPTSPVQNPPANYGGVIPTGTTITVRMIDSVDSDQSRMGQTYRASVDEPLQLDGQTVIPRGADAIVKLVEDKQSGKFEGRTVLTLELTHVTINGRLLDITTGDVSQASGSRGSRTAKVVGGTTALGAIVGALAGGGKGAAIGAASGAAVGGGVELATHGQRVKIPSETRLTFTLQQPVQL